MKSNREANKEIQETFEQPVEKVVKEMTEEQEKKAPVIPKKYIVTVTNLALRIGPGKEYDRIGLADAGTTLITEIKNGYGKLADGSGWVSMSYLRKAD